MSSSSSAAARPHPRHRPQSLPFVPHAAPFLPSFASLISSSSSNSHGLSGVSSSAASEPLSPALAALSPSFLLSHSNESASRRSSGASSSSSGTHASCAALRTPRARAWSLDEAKTPTLASCSQQQAQAQQQHAAFSALPHRAGTTAPAPAPAPSLSLTSPSATAPPRPLHAPSSAALEARRLRSSSASSSSSSKSPASLSVGGGGDAADAHTYEYEYEPQRLAHDEARLARLAAEAKAAAAASASAAAAGRSGSSAEAAALFLRSWLQASYAPHSPSPREEPPTVRRAALVRSYELACAELRLEPLTKASVGKAVRVVWPEIQSKRLGPRGGSLAHYINFVPLTSLEHARLGEANRQLDAEAQTAAYAALDGYTSKPKHARSVSAASSRSVSSSTEGSSSEGSSPAKRAVSRSSSRSSSAQNESARSTPAVTLNEADSMDIDAPPGLALELELAGEQVARRMDFSAATSSSSFRLGTTAAAAASVKRSSSAQFFFAGDEDEGALASFDETMAHREQVEEPDLLRAVAAYASVGALAQSPEHTPRLSARTSPIKQALASSLLQAEDGEEEEEFPPRTSRRRIRSRTSSSALEEMGYGAQSAAARAVRSVPGWPQMKELARQLDGMGLMAWEEMEDGCERMLRAFRELQFDEFKTAATELYTELPREALWAIWGSSLLCDAVLQAERALYEHLLRFLDEHIADPPIEAVCSALRDLAVSYPTEVQAALQGGSGSRGRFPDAFIVSRTELSWRWCECLLAVNSIWADIIELRARFSLSSAHWELSPTLSTTSTSSSLSADVSDAFSAFRPHSRDESWASVHTYASSEEDSSLASPPPAGATLAHEAHKWEQMRQRDVAAQQQQQQGSRHDGLGLENLGLEELHAASEADAQLMYDEAALLRCGSLA